MKNLILIISFLLSLGIVAQKTQFQRYNVETGRVNYKTETKKETIIKTVVFKNWGATEYIVEKKTTYKGKKKRKIVKERTQITKLENALVYTVDDKEKQILQVKNYGLVLYKNKNLSTEGKRISEFNGGKKVGEETIAGYPCKIWNLKGIITSMYKGVPLRTKVRNKVEIATKAQFDIPITNADVALPDYPIKNVNPWQDTDDAVDYYSTEEGQQEIIEAGENTKEAGEDTLKAYEDAKIMEWDAWYKKYKSANEFEGATKQELRDFYDESRKTIQNRIDDRVQDRINNRINNRINDRINHRSTSPKPRGVRKPRIPKPW